MHAALPLAERQKVDRGRRRGAMRSQFVSTTGGTPIATRRRVRQRRLEGGPQRCRSDETASSHSTKSAIRKHPLRRRYVKSKPPTLMPGGRVICAGEGTLTEVSKSFYVAYGSADLTEATRGIHLVVPVRDELQEATDDERVVDDVASPTHSAAQSHDRAFQELSCASLFLETPPMAPLTDTEANTSGVNALEEPAFMAALNSGLPSTGPTSAQLPINWYSTTPWNAVSPNLPTYPSKLNQQVSAATEFDSRWFNDVYGEAIDYEAPRDAPPPPHIIHRNDVHERPSSSPYCPPTALPELATRGHDDCSYFHLADELMPENKTPLPQSSFGPRYWEMFPSQRPRCGMAPVELPPMMTPPVHALGSRACYAPMPHWEAEPFGIPPFGVAPQFSSLPHPIQRRTQINTPMPPLAALLSEHAPYLHTQSNLLI